MSLFQQRVYWLFVYFVVGRPGFWIFDGQGCHHFHEANGRFHYVRACLRLPDYAFGECVEVAASPALALNRVALKAGVNLAWFADECECELGEIRKGSATYVFGLSLPAGHISFSDSIGRSPEV